MGKNKDSALDAAIRDLGGDDEDLKLVADADFSGSDYEDALGGSRNVIDASEVEKMWNELSGISNGSSNKKKVFEEKKEEVRPALNEVIKEVKNKKEKKAKSEKKEKNEKAKNDKSEKNQTELTKNAAREKPVAKPAVKPAPKPQPLSKKSMAEWEKYMSTLVHPQSGLILDQQEWYTTSQPSEDAPLLPVDIVNTLKQKAMGLLNVENQIYYKHRAGDREFTSSLEFLKSGTFSDQLGTLSILSTESPLHSIRFLENLISKCEIKNRESACKALEVTKDLLVSHVMPDNRLKWFKDQPLKLGLPTSILIAWAFEDYLKRYFFKLLQAMERLLIDTVENIRMRALLCVFEFFQQKPEQESNLLRLGLNKLGDPAGKVASKVKKLVMDVLQMHPGMKSIIANATAELLSRTSDYRTRYYAVDTLSEFILSNRDPGLANQLIYIYLELFGRLLVESKDAIDTREEKTPNAGKIKKGIRFRPKRGKKGGLKQEKLDKNEYQQQQQTRLVAKIFTGLNRAFPFSNLDPAEFSKYTDTLYHMSHSPNVGTFIEALSFIFQLSKAEANSMDSKSNRYYRTLYRSLMDNRLQKSSKLAKYIHLLLKSMTELKNVEDIAEVEAFIKRSLQVACNWSDIGALASLIQVANLSMTSRTTNLVEDGPSKSMAGELLEDNYDPKQRDPRYAHADTSKTWEAILLQRHFHPTVALYANNFLAPEREKVTLGMPDIDQYTVSSFLSKWSYKKPKEKESSRGGSIFQPLSGYVDLALGIRQEKKGDSTPASMQNWKSKGVDDIAPDEQFLFDYFIHRPDRKPKVKKEALSTAGDESDADNIAEDDINDAMIQSGLGDLGGNDMTGVDFDSDSEEDGDLEAGLEAAFNESDLEDDDEDDNDSEGEAYEGSSGEDIPEAFKEGEDKDFTDFGKLEEEMLVKKDGSTDAVKKRKRWSTYPAFLDADAFEEMYTHEETPAKKR